MHFAQDPRTLLVRAPNWVGDLVMATPAFRALREGFPAARIAVQLREGLRPLLEGAPWFDEVLPLHASGRSAWGFARDAWQLRRRRFDVGLCLPESFSSALLMRLGGVRCVVGYRRDARSLLLHRAVEPPGPRRGRLLVPRERHVLGLVEALGCPARGSHLELFTTGAEEARAAAALAARGVAPEAPLALLAPGASYGPAKLWGAERFAVVGDALAGAGAHVVLVGTPAEGALCARVAARMTAPVADLGGALDLGALKALIRRARVLVCNDAGARHVAVAFGVPCVVMFGPTSLEKTGLNLERVTVFEATDVSCRPCYRRSCPIDHRCMTRISPERVARAALAALRAGPGGAGARACRDGAAGEAGRGPARWAA
jgi:heptosyltransferase-2